MEQDIPSTIDREPVALNIHAACVLVLAGEPGAYRVQGYPTIWVEASQPDVADLWRIHTSEGNGKIFARWHRQATNILLRCELLSPVRLVFALTFAPPYHSFLEEVAASRQLTLISQPQPGWLSTSSPSRDRFHLSLTQVDELRGVTFNFPAQATQELQSLIDPEWTGASYNATRKNWG